MPDNNFDGVIALGDAGIREAESQAKIAQMMAETAIKWQEVQHEHLKNIGLFLKIKWDAQAHDNLHRTVLKAQRQVDTLKLDKARLLSKIEWANRLLRGAEVSLDGVTQAWLGFYFIRNKLPGKIVIEAFNAVDIDDDAFVESSWCHPWYDRGAVVHQFVGHKDPSTLFAWASRSNYYPVFGEPAWEYMRDIMLAFDEAAEEAAEVKDKEISEAEAKALELSKIDWDQLKQGDQGGQQKVP